MRKALRYLRITFSVTCGIFCLLLIVLWVRSYWWHDIVACGIKSKEGIRIDSTNGGITLGYMRLHEYPITFVKWKVTNIWSPSEGLFPIGFVEGSYAGFLIERFTDGFSVSVPYWFLVPLFGALGIVTYKSKLRRFSLRTLLIAITLVALLLGAIVVSLQ